MITIEKLSAGYDKLVILHDLSLNIARGQFTAILGPNGSGKSTLLKSIFGLTHIFNGSIQLQGQELIGLPTEQVSQNGIAYVPQRDNVFTAMSVRENLLLTVRNLDRTAASGALEEAYRMFPILGKRKNQRAEQLSGGERQMLAIAIGWLLRPQVMLLDEPTAGLSPLLTTEVFETLHELSQQDITIVVVEQNARSVLRWCDYAYVLREGQLVFQGTAQACLADEETIKSYLGVSASDIALEP